MGQFRATSGGGSSQRGPDPGQHGLGDLRAFVPADDPDAQERLRRVRGRDSIAVIGLHRVRDSDLPAGSSERVVRAHGAWHLGKHYRWIDWVAVLWILFISIVFMLPFAKVGIPGNEGFTWDFVNYTPITVGTAFLLFGGWYVLSAHKWFKGPIRQGDDGARADRAVRMPPATTPVAGA